MIARMKKLTILCIREHQEPTLHSLQEMGVLHVEHIHEPGGALLEETRAHYADVLRAGEILRHYEQERAAQGWPPPPVDPDRSADSVVDEIWKLINLRKDYEEALDHWQREIGHVEPFGFFDPDAIRELEKKKVYIRLYKAGSKQEIVKPDGDDVTLTVHHRNGEGVFLSIISREPVEAPYEPVKLPEQSLRAMRKKVSDLQDALKQNRESFLALTGYLPHVNDIVQFAEDKVLFLEARTGMGAVKPVAYLRGYCPERDVDKIRETARRLGWGILVADPTDEDRAPTKIENPRWVRPIRTVFSFIGVVPGYKEVDISAVFLLFFSLFFAMIVGDAGYGALFLSATIWAHLKFKAAPASVFHLLYITSIATIVWGALTGNYFGMAAIPGALETARIEWLLDDLNIMLLCFLIGAIHLTIAHTWNLIRYINTLQALAQAGWIGIVWFMFFLARYLVLNQELPFIMIPVFVVGLVMLVLFMTPFSKMKTEWIGHVMLPLNLVSNFVDVVSYVRLFAVGTATLAVASAFNQMAMEIGAGSRIGGLFAVIIIFFGHTLNILLAAMGVLVHGIRLNTLEFAGHMGLQWTGIRFMPFMRKSERAPIIENEKKHSENE